MPVTVNIDGLGDVELDDSFRSKSHDEQDAIIQQITSQARGAHPAAGTGTPDTYPVLERIVKQLYPHATFGSDKRTPEHNAAVGGVPDSHHLTGNSVDISGLSEQERSDLRNHLEGMGIHLDEYLYHKVPKGGGMHLHVTAMTLPEGLLNPQEDTPPKDKADAPPTQQGQADPHFDGNAQALAIQQMIDGGKSTDDIISRFPKLETVGGNRAAIDWWVANRKHGGHGQTLFNQQNGSPAATPPAAKDAGYSLSDFGHDLKIRAGDVGEALIDNSLLPFQPAVGIAQHFDPSFNPAASAREKMGIERGSPMAEGITKGVVSGLLSVGSAPMVGGLRGVGGLAEGLGREAVSGGLSGAAQVGAQQMGADPLTQTAAGLIAGVAGHKLAHAGTAEARNTRFANNQVKSNPFASHDAEIVRDIRGATTDRAVAGTDPKGRAPVTAKTLNSVEGRYTARFDTLLNQVDMPATQRLRLKEALTNKFSLPQDEVDALRGTTAGDAVADAITKVQRFRQLTPELARGTSKLATLGKVVSTGMDLVPGIPGVTGRAVRWATKAAGGDAEAARVNAAENLIKRGPAYDKVGDLAGPSGQIESQQALWDAADATTTAKQQAAAAKQQAAAEKQAARAKAQQALKKLNGDNERVGVKNNQDDIVPGGGFRGLIYQHTGLLPSAQDTGALKALAAKKLTPEQFDAFLNSPDKLMTGNAGNALIDRFKAMAEDGTLQRDPKWQAPEPTPQAPAAASAPMVDAQGKPIQSMPAYQGGIAKNIARQLHLEQKLDELDPVMVTLADGSSSRASDLGKLSPEEAAQVADIRNQLANMKPQPKN